MKGFFTAKRLCRAGIIAALYVALTYAFGALSYQGFVQIRPAEALCILPLFFPEAVPALYIGCMLANVASPFWIYDVFIGSLATLFAAVGTWLIGKFFRNNASKIVLGGPRRKRSGYMPWAFPSIFLSNTCAKKISPPFPIWETDGKKKQNNG